MDDLDTYARRLCDLHGITELELVRDLIRPMFETKQRDMYQWELRLNKLLKTFLSDKLT